MADAELNTLEHALLPAECEVSGVNTPAKVIVVRYLRLGPGGR